MTHLVDHVRQAQPGNRNDALYWAAHRALDNGSTDLAPLVAAAMEAGLDHRETQRTVSSAQHQRISSGGRQGASSASRRASPARLQQQAPPAPSI